MTPDPSFGRVARSTALIALLVYLTTTGGSFATDLASYEVTKNLVEHGSVAMSYDVLATEAERGVDGRYYAPVGIVHPLFGVPFYVAARSVERSAGLQLGKPESLRKAAVVTGSVFAAAGCVWIAALFAWRLTGRASAAVPTALALAFGTSLWPYSKFGFNAPMAAMWLFGAAYGAWVGTRTGSRRHLVAGGCSLGLALLTRHEMGVGALPAALWLWLESGERRQLVGRAGLFFAPVAAALGLWMCYNYARFGHPLDTGLLRDPNVSFDTPLIVGLYGLLVSPGRSLFLYSPLVIAGAAALVALARRDRATALFLAAHPLVFLPVYAMMRQWDGGESWGARYLVPVLPVLVLPLAEWFHRPLRSRARRLAFGAVLTLSVLVQLPGVLMDFSKVQNAYAQSRPDYSIALSRYTWSASPLVLNTRAALEAVPKNVGYLLRNEPPPVQRTSDEENRGFSQQFAFSYDFWWLYLFYLGALPAPAALGLGLVPLALAISLAIRLRTASLSFRAAAQATASGAAPSSTASHAGTTRK